MKKSALGLDSLFKPKSIAVIGASSTPGKMGTTSLFCIKAANFKGKIYPINPKETETQGIKAYDNITSVPDRVDLAIICVGAATVPQVIEECAQAGTKFGLVVSAGFGEIDQDGKELEEKIVQTACEKGMRLIGPNSMGIGSAPCSLYSTINFTIPAAGDISVVSQSGTLATIITMGGSAEGIGFCKYISSGNEADLHSGDFIEYFAHDPETKVVIAFIEGVKDGKEFMRASKEVTKNKPFIILKGGTTEAGTSAVQSHTGSLAGSGEVFDAMCTQAGVIHATNSRDVINLAKGFSLLPLPKGRKVAIVSAQGGLGVLMADACAKQGLEIAKLSKKTCEELDSFLPYFWSRGNPVDVTGGVVDLREITRALDVLLRQDDIHSTICVAPTFSSIFSPVASRISHTDKKTFESMSAWVMGEMEKDFAKDITDMRAKYNKPIIGASLLPSLGSETVKVLESKGIPVYYGPDQIAYVISKLNDYREYRTKRGYQV